jgi:hypothetical protein
MGGSLKGVKRNLGLYGDNHASKTEILEDIVCISQFLYPLCLA